MELLKGESMLFVLTELGLRETGAVGELPSSLLAALCLPDRVQGHPMLLALRKA